MPQVYKVGDDSWTFIGAPHWYKSKRKANLAYKKKYDIDPRTTVKTHVLYEEPTRILAGGTAQAQIVGAEMSWFEEIFDILEPVAKVADILIPEELIGADITPGWHYFPGGGRAKQYNDVYIKGGRIYAGSADGRMLGYTSSSAKKKFRTKRRRKRLTKRDMYILEVMKQTPGVGALALML